MDTAPIIIGKDYCSEQADDRARRRVVVTGASGMLGSYLVAELLDRGYRDITLMVRSLASLEKIRVIWQAEGIGYDVEKLDIAGFQPEDEESAAETFRGADTVFNCAATVAIGGLEREELIRTNVAIARTVSRAALRAGNRLLVHVSSVAALTASGSGKVDAMSVPGCGPKPSPYAESKFLSELEIAESARRGLMTVTVNPVTILGFGLQGHGSASVIPAIARGIPVYPPGTTGWVDARDVARAMVMLADCPKAAGKRFVMSCGNTSYRDLISAGCTAAGRSAPLFPLPEFAARAACGADKLYSKLARRGRVLTPELVSILYGEHYYDGDDIKNYINFEYSPLPSTIDRLVKLYLRSVGK